MILSSNSKCEEMNDLVTEQCKKNYSSIGENQLILTTNVNNKRIMHVLLDQYPS